MRTFPCTINRVVDGDTVDVTVDLGFHISHKVRVRFSDYDAPETRTKDLAEKKRGLAAKAYLEEIIDNLTDENSYTVLESYDIGKYGRCIGDIVINGHSLIEMMKEAGHEK